MMKRHRLITSTHRYQSQNPHQFDLEIHYKQQQPLFQLAKQQKTVQNTVATPFPYQVVKFFSTSSLSREHFSSYSNSEDISVWISQHHTNPSTSTIAKYAYNHSENTQKPIQLPQFNINRERNRSHCYK